MMLLIYMDLSNKRRWFKKHILKLSIAAILISVVVAFAPIKTFGVCLVGDYQLYCGYCFEYDELSLGQVEWLFYLVPGIIGIVLWVMLSRAKRRLT